MDGTLEKVRFTSEDGVWQVVVIRLAGTGGEATVVGNLAGAHEGESLRLSGRWTVHPKFGRRFEVQSFRSVKPATAEGMERYLASGLIPGIGKELAARMVRQFGERTLDVIESEPARLAEVEGIGPKRSRQILEAWKAQRNVRDIMVFLQSYGVSTGLAARIFKAYGAAARRLIEENPYRLAEDLAGVGFRTADRIARALGTPDGSPNRVQAGVLHALTRKAEEGHTVVSRSELAEWSGRLLGVTADRCDAEIDALCERGAAVREDSGGLIGLPALVRDESYAARALARLATLPLPAARVDTGAAISGFESAAGIRLSGRQRQAVSLALTEKVLIVTGGPGTGKTTLLKAILAVARAARRDLLLCAPTGRAAKRITEACGAEARTIHRLLEYSPQTGGFLRGESNPLSCHTLIVDEASMIDVTLFRSLLQAVPPSGQLILVGDKDQLPSVGPGNVLGDLIASAVLPVVELDEVFRQAERSAITLNAHRINRGEMPEMTAAESGDFFFIERDEPPEILATVRELVAERIPRRFGLDPRADIQVLVPMQKGTVGVAALNAELQAALNPPADAPPGAAPPGGPAAHASPPGANLRAGDRVMQTRNDYERGVFNGDIGRVEIVQEGGKGMSVRFDERVVSYPPEDVDGLMLAYACSIHKSQGSEFPAVVVVLHTQHFVLLARNLLYTAVTRGRRLTVIVGSRKALAMAVKSVSARPRVTLLARRLREALPREALPREAAPREAAPREALPREAAPHITKPPAPDHLP